MRVAGARVAQAAALLLFVGLPAVASAQTVTTTTVKTVTGPKGTTVTTTQVTRPAPKPAKAPAAPTPPLPPDPSIPLVPQSAPTAADLAQQVGLITLLCSLQPYTPADTLACPAWQASAQDSAAVLTYWATEGQPPAVVSALATALP